MREFADTVSFSAGTFTKQDPLSWAQTISFADVFDTDFELVEGAQFVSPPRTDTFTSMLRHKTFTSPTVNVNMNGIDRVVTFISPKRKDNTREFTVSKDI